MAPAARSLPVWLLAFVAAVFAAWVSRRRESAQLRGLFRQLDVGRRHYEAERWEAADDALGAELDRRAAQLLTPSDRVAAWRPLLEAAAHRAKAAARAAERVAGAAERLTALHRAVGLFDAVVQRDSSEALQVLDFVYEHSTLLRRINETGRAKQLFLDAEAVHLNTGSRFPWPSAEQMPCCDFQKLSLTSALLRRLRDTAWRDDVASHAVPKALLAAADDIRADVLALLAAEPAPGAAARRHDAFVSLEGHGAEVVGGGSGTTLGAAAAPWSELVLYDSSNFKRPRDAWHAANCALVPAACKALKNVKALAAPPEGVAASAFCCRVEVLRLEAGSRIVPHTAPTDVRLKAHLGLQVPSGAALDVAGETRPWRDGEVFVFDDSFWHQAWNNHSSEPRLILSVDFWKPA